MLNSFFKKVEDHYADAVVSIKELIEQGDEFETNHLEVRFMLHLIFKLRQNLPAGSEFNTATLEEMLKGAHVKFEDNGTFYDEMVNLYKSNLNKRTSSHSSNEQQYSISGPVVKEVLFGVAVDKDGKKTTWMQFERHHTRSIIEFIMHIYDYLLYKWSGKNIGPFGESVHTEHNNPLVLRVTEQEVLQEDVHPQEAPSTKL